MRAEKIITRALQSYWRLTRGLTMGAQGVIVDSEKRVLLIRHTYRPGWHFPGGGVEKNETLETALTRELQEETGVLLHGPANLFGVYSNFRAFPSDHIALFVVENWEQPEIPQANKEIAEQGFFSLGNFPKGTTDPVRRRVNEVFSGHPRDQIW